MSELIDTIARIIWSADQNSVETPFEKVSPFVLDDLEDTALAIIAALPDDRASIAAYLAAEAQKRKGSRIESRVLRAMVDAVKAGLDRV